MTYYITALTNDKAELIVSETRTSDIKIAEMVTAKLESEGYKVKIHAEG